MSSIHSRVDSHLASCVVHWPISKLTTFQKCLWGNIHRYLDIPQSKQKKNAYLIIRVFVRTWVRVAVGLGLVLAPKIGFRLRTASVKYRKKMPFLTHLVLGGLWNKYVIPGAYVVLPRLVCKYHLPFAIYRRSKRSPLLVGLASVWSGV